MFRNKQFFDWTHFKEKLALRFLKRTYAKSPVVDAQISNILALLQKIENKYSFTSKQVIVEDVSISVATIFHGEIASPLVEEHSSHVDNVEGLPNTFINDLLGHVDNMLDEMSTGVFTKEREETSSASSCVADLDYSKSPKVFNECFPSCCPLLVAEVQPDTPNKMLDEEAPGPNQSVAQLIDECSPKDMSKRYVTATSLVRSFNKPKIGFETCEDLYLAEFFLEPATIEDLYYEKQILEIENCIPQSTMPLDDMMLVVEHENYTEELNAHNILCQFPFNPGATSLNVVVQETIVNFCVWNPGISFKSKSLTRSTMKEKPLLLLRSTIMFCSIAYANSVILVWDPGWQCRVHYLIFLCEFTWCMSLANRKGWQFLLVVYPYGSKVMNNDSDEPQVEALKLSCLISHIPTTNEVPPLEKHISDPPHSKFLTSLLFGMLSKEYVFPSYHSLSSYQVVSSSTQMTMFYTNTSPYYCSTLQFSHWDISDKKGPKRRVIAVLLLQAKLGNFSLSFWIRTGKFIKMTYLSIIFAETTQLFWSFLALVCYYLIIFSCFVTLQLCQGADGEHDICELLCYIFLILPRVTKTFQHQHNFLVLWRCATMWVEFIQLKGGSLVSYCAEILEVGNWFWVRLQLHRQHSMRLQLAAQIYLLWCNSRLKHYTNQLHQQSMLLQNLEDKVLDSGRSIVVNQTNYIRAYGLEVMNEAGPFKIIGLIKMLESFIWDPGPTIN